MNICVILPGMPATEDEWFLPYLVDYLQRLRTLTKLKVYALKHPGRNAQYSIGEVPVQSFAGRFGLQKRVLDSIIADHADLFDDPDFDIVTALKHHRRVLEQRHLRTAVLLNTIDKTITTLTEEQFIM